MGAVIYIFGLIKVGFIFSFYSDSGFCGRRPGRLDRSVKAFVDFIGSSPARKNKRFCFSLAYSKNSLTVGTPRKLVRHYRSGVQKKQDDTCQSSNGSPTRTPETNKYRNNSTFISINIVYHCLIFYEMRLDAFPILVYRIRFGKNNQVSWLFCSHLFIFLFAN